MAKIINSCLRVGVIAGISAAVALAVILLAFAANLAALSAGPDRIKNTLIHAIDDGTLLDKSALDPLALLSLRTGHEINTYPVECFIWTTLLAEPPGGLLVKVLRTPRLDPTKGPPDSRGPPSPPCQAVLQSLAPAPPNFARPQIYFYDRYIVGQRAIARAAPGTFLGSHHHLDYQARRFRSIRDCPDIGLAQAQYGYRFDRRNLSAVRWPELLRRFAFLCPARLRPRRRPAGSHLCAVRHGRVRRG